MSRSIHWWTAPMSAATFAGTVGTLSRLGITDTHPETGRAALIDDEGEPVRIEREALRARQAEILGAGAAAAEQLSFQWWPEGTASAAYGEVRRLPGELRYWMFALDGTSDEQQAHVVRTTLGLAVSALHITRCYAVDLTGFAEDLDLHALVAEGHGASAYPWDLCFAPDKHRRKHADFTLRVTNAALGRQIGDGGLA
ncbi:hypothetical protein OJ997_22710 [Solirubrobacter phytolaccae]|uniref:Uncharacterized protein n=1 Tax=Solirubrobacter phytolaccae TaxID=1404360 RepID=A0A9X3S993_9ACTN|nr:hypothetical protein [Solirubrobacter phytolaccae]MDA0183139.1 hypothetical protein [Solirubrobacter phytolaccae]